jgi:hypothetical protein
MVVFKKRCAPVTNAITQDKKQKDQHEAIPTHEAATSAPTAPPVSKAVFGTLRYSDMVAERKCKINVTPIKKLVDTFELFEQVLDYLPMKEVLLATRVCRAFKTNIENSSRLQAKLFLAPDLTMKKMAVSSSGTLLSGVKAEQHIAAAEGSGSSQISDSGDYERDMNNTLHTALKAARLSDRDRDGGEIELYISHPELRGGRLSDRYRHAGIVQYAETYVQTYHRGSYSHRELTFCNLPTVATLPPTSSLSRMFLSQPPVKEVDVSYLLWTKTRPSDMLGPHTPRRQIMVWETIRKEAGVTFGDVVAAVRRSTKPDSVEWSCVYMSTAGGFEVNARARRMAETSGELSREDDPTRWVDSDSDKVLQEGGFAFA